MLSGRHGAVPAGARVAAAAGLVGAFAVPAGLACAALTTLRLAEFLPGGWGRPAALAAAFPLAHAVLTLFLGGILTGGRPPGPAAPQGAPRGGAAPAREVAAVAAVTAAAWLGGAAGFWALFVVGFTPDI